MKQVNNFLVLTMMVFIFVSTSMAFPKPDPEETRAVTSALAKAKSELQKHLKSQARDEIRPYDVLDYDLGIIPDFQTEQISGTILVTALSQLDGLQIIELDMSMNLNPIRVFNESGDLPYSHVDDLISIELNQIYNMGDQFSIQIEYDGKPPKSIFKFSEHNGEHVFSTQSEPEYGRTWWPSNDVPWDKATSTVHLTLPQGMRGISNGLVSTDIDNQDGTHTITWENSYPIATYLISVAGTNYAEINFEYLSQDKTTTMPVPVYVYPESKDLAMVDFEDTVDMIDFFSKNFGEYPFLNEKYGQVMVPMGGGMEHQTITHINAIYVNGHGLLSLVAHELAHQWWGDFITMETWPDIWLNESFATYSDALYQEYRFGWDHLKNVMESYAARHYQGSIYNPDQLFDDIVYSKGACVLHMLRYIVGEDQFWSILQTYYSDQRFQYANASTENFIDICESVTGQDLQWFFDQWIYGQDRPTYQYLWDYSYIDGKYDIDLTIDQIQTTTGLFKMPLQVEIQTDTNTTIFNIENATASEQYHFQSDLPPVNLTIDPSSWVLKWLQPHPNQFQITSDSRLPAMIFGSAYDYQIEVSGGTPPYQFKIIAGELPPGLILDENSGEISGVPQSNQRFNFTLRVNDSRDFPRNAQKKFNIKGGALEIKAEISLNQTLFHGNDDMIPHLYLKNNRSLNTPVDIYIVLEIAENFYFLDIGQSSYPAFSIDPANIPFEIPPDFETGFDLFGIPLPKNLSHFDGSWYCAVLNSDSYLITPLSQADFSYE